MNIYRYSIFKIALKDWKNLMDKYNSIENKSIENFKKIFMSQSNNQEIFNEIEEGIIRAFLSTNGIIGGDKRSICCNS